MDIFKLFFSLFLLFLGNKSTNKLLLKFKSTNSGRFPKIEKDVKLFFDKFNFFNFGYSFSENNSFSSFNFKEDKSNSIILFEGDFSFILFSNISLVNLPL